PYLVLARKYRPLDFSGLIGQDAMVQTFANSFKNGRIHHAFILTGVRGVGKTTTARILARAFNYEDDKGRRPTLEMAEYGVHCQAIVQGRHVDVIEMDAASNTGIDDIREIIDSVRYAPASAPYKVYIIDEVHMLSKQAFNGLLKTLEEPPPYVKFIFATTEIRKVPVTVLSRCQRFDLRRITPEVMGDYLEKLLGKENIAFEADALGMIVRAGEGSVRDCLSLTDQAIAHGDGKVEATSVRAMLGLADAGQTIDLFESLMEGDIAGGLEITRTLYDAGADPQQIVADLAQFTHLVTRIKMVEATSKDPSLTPDERTRGKEISAKLGVRSLTRTWQILQAGLGEIAQSGNAIQALEMVLIRLAHASDLPTPDELIQKLSRPPQTSTPSKQSDAPGTTGGNHQAQRRSATAGSSGPALAHQNLQALSPRDEEQQHADASPKNFAELVALAASNRDLQIKHALETDVRPIRFEEGRIEIALTERADRGIVNKLSTRLKQWTGRNWLISVSNANQKAHAEAVPTLRETKEAAEKARYQAAQQDPLVVEIFKNFPDAKLVDVRALELSSPEDD
ncbi:MAG TPA: DNA polymerase III subunit gamma/tau, partial [Devosia sp.]|nr:DNA polymerase III subunit gamma/tau [Devosia sp.]